MKIVKLRKPAKKVMPGGAAKFEEPPKQETASSAGPKSPAKKKKMVRLRFYEDQWEIVSAAIQKAKRLSGTKYNAVAFEYICIDFLGSANFPRSDVNH